LGGGDGFVLRELFKYPEEKIIITHVELDEDFLLFYSYI
jgi:predicted membrane-bound spermidine synthase